MYRDDYKHKNNVLLTILFILLICVAAGAVYFYMNKNSVQEELAAIDKTDFSAGRVVSEKGEKNEAPGIAFSAQTQEALSNDVYLTPLGFPIISNSDKWKGDKLVEIYNELLNNVHGREMKYISKVIIYPGGSEQGTDEIEVAGTHTTKLESYSVFFDVPAIVPESLSYKMRSTLSVIELYNMDEFDNIKQAAKTIAHEYGHHFTIFYFMQDDRAAFESEYYDIRNLDEYEQAGIFENVNEYYANHEWSIYEIAAEDYVQLLGSQTAKQPKEYLDIQDLLQQKYDEYYINFDETTVNVLPQENIHIPLADEVNGLRDYFYSFIDAENDLERLAAVDFNLSIEKHNKYYNINWIKTSTHKDSLYTLVCYDLDENLFRPVKTINGDEPAVATVGKVTHETTTSITTWSLNITDENRYFRLFLLLPDGRMQSSELFFVEF